MRKIVAENNKKMLWVEDVQNSRINKREFHWQVGRKNLYPKVRQWHLGVFPSRQVVILDKNGNTLSPG